MFTDNRIRVQNKCKEFKTCFLNQLTTVIDAYEGEKIMALSEVESLMEVVDEMTFVTRYEPKLDVQKFKRDFAELVSAMDYPEESKNKTKEGWWKAIITAITTRKAA